MDHFERFSDDIKKDINKFINQELAEDMERQWLNGGISTMDIGFGNKSDCPECENGRMKYKTTVRGYKKYRCDNCDAVELRD